MELIFLCKVSGTFEHHTGHAPPTKPRTHIYLFPISNLGLFTTCLWIVFSLSVLALTEYIFYFAQNSLPHPLRFVKNTGHALPTDLQTPLFGIHQNFGCHTKFFVFILLGYIHPSNLGSNFDCTPILCLSFCSYIPNIFRLTISVSYQQQQKLFPTKNFNLIKNVNKNGKILKHQKMVVFWLILNFGLKWCGIYGIKYLVFWREGI